MRQIARHARASAGAVQRELEGLAQLGLIDRQTVGRQVFCKANRQHPVFRELQALVAKTVGVFQLLASALEPLEARITSAFVYGSMARGEEKAGSDVDLMVVGDLTLDEVLGALKPVEAEIGREINPTLYTPKEFKRRLKEGNHFLRSVMAAEKVILVGADDELGKVG